MKIKYRHVGNPKIEKTHDTEKAYVNMDFAIHDPQSKLYNITQKEFDQIQLETFKRDKQRGIICDYEIIEF